MSFEKRKNNIMLIGYARVSSNDQNLDYNGLRNSDSKLSYTGGRIQLY